jgi:alkaline phosphatase D
MAWLRPRPVAAPARLLFALGVCVGIVACEAPPRSFQPAQDIEIVRTPRRELPPFASMDEVPLDAAAFPLGVASGFAQTGTLLWTRQESAAALSIAVYAEDDDNGLAPVLYAHVDDATSSARTVRVIVEDLDPGRVYRYAFFAAVDDNEFVRSEIGRHRVPSGDLQAPTTLAATSCTELGFSVDVLGEVGARDDVDGFLFLGDTVYADGAFTLGEYSAFWQATLAQPAFRALRKNTGVLATWDDHEVGNNWDPESIAPNQLEAARTAFFQHQPIDKDPEHPERIWRKRRIGSVDVFVLDSRSERVPSTRLTATEQYISPLQMEFLQRELLASDAPFKVIMNSVPIIDLPLPAAHEDRWAGFPRTRSDILGFIEEHRIAGVLWLAGDLHLATLGFVSSSGPGARSFEVLAGPGGKSGLNPLQEFFHPPRFSFVTPENNVAYLYFEPRTMSVRVVHQGENGRVLHEQVIDLSR